MHTFQLKLLSVAFAAGCVLPPGSYGQGAIAYVAQSTNLHGIPGVPWSHDFDLDSDGVADYRFDNDGAISYVSPLGSNRQIASPATPPDMGSSLSPLSAGEMIGSSLDPVLGQWVDQSSPNMAGHSTISGCFNVGCSGPFAYRTAFMGFDFVAGDGQRHFGWLRIDDSVPGGHVFLVDWAWTVTPGQSIASGAVPEPSTLALFGVGSIAFWFARQKRLI